MDGSVAAPSMGCDLNRLCATDLVIWKLTQFVYLILIQSTAHATSHFGTSCQEEQVDGHATHKVTFNH